MREYQDFRHGELFLKDLKVNLEEAAQGLHGACASSTDPRVRGEFARHNELKKMIEFLEMPRKERK